MTSTGLLRRLAFNGVRVSQLTESITLDGQTYPAGTWVIPTDQEFACSWASVPSGAISRLGR